VKKKRTLRKRFPADVKKTKAFRTRFISAFALGDIIHHKAVKEGKAMY